MAAIDARSSFANWSRNTQWEEGQAENNACQIEVMIDVEFTAGAEQSRPSVRTPHNSGSECSYSIMHPIGYISL